MSKAQTEKTDLSFELQFETQPMVRQIFNHILSFLTNFYLAATVGEFAETRDFHEKCRRRNFEKLGKPTA